MHPPGELAAAGLQGERRFRVEPEDGLVLVAIAVGVLDGGLGLADAAQAADGLGVRAALRRRVSRFRKSATTSSRPVKNSFRGWGTLQNGWPTAGVPAGGDGPI